VSSNEDLSMTREQSAPADAPDETDSSPAAEAAPSDGGPTNGGPTDGGPPDAGPPDAGPPDAGPPDAGPIDGGATPSGTTRRWRPWMSWFAGIALVLAIVMIAGSAIRLPYYTISPGASLDLNSRITIDGAKSYDTDDAILLLFVRERARVNVWRWLQASFDSNIDLFKEKQFTGGQSPEEVRVESDADMARSQLAAKKLALEAAGHTVPVGQGIQVLAVQPSRPAAGVIEPGDVLLAVDGTALTKPDDLSTAVRAKKAGDPVALTLQRDGQEKQVTVRTEAGDDGAPVIGVIVSGRYDFPIDVKVDTSQIGGPSAGLAMTLSILDQLTPGNLAGGKRVAVTGTISEDGSVGEIGGIAQKATTAKASGAQLFIVPACTRADIKAECEKELKKAEQRANGMRVVPVATFDEALAALRAAGGDPVDVAAKPAA
jgi:PDZ domain-containing protein